MIYQDLLDRCMMGNTIPFTEEEVKAYLDRTIRAWRKVNAEGNEDAIFYIDAFQSIRSSIFGETLP